MTASQDEATGTQEHVAPPEAWDAIADGYDRYVAPQEAELATEALHLVGLEPGERFLDVAAGTGGLSLPAARLGAQVLATDWAPAMIERFQARLREMGLSRAEGRVMDCHALELPDDSFDVTGSQFGVMLVPDQPPRAPRDGPGDEARRARARDRLRLARGARVPPGIHQRPEGGCSGVPWPPRRSAAAGVPGVRPGRLAPAADRRGIE
jgi:SAM-dependent methyltransferase